MNTQLIPKRHWLLTLILLLPLTAVAETIQVDPLEFDYGEVMVGSDMPMEFTITSTGPTPLRVENVSIVYDADGYFLITDMTPNVGFPYSFDEGEELLVEVTFEPFAAVSTGASLRIVSDATNGAVIDIPLQGEGVIISPTPEGLMDYVLVYYNAGVVNDTILGVGTGKRAEKRIDKFEVLLYSSEGLIHDGDVMGALEELNDAYVRIDGIDRPKDYLVGPAVPTLSTLITLVIDALNRP